MFPEIVIPDSYGWNMNMLMDDGRIGIASILSVLVSHDHNSYGSHELGYLIHPSENMSYGSPLDTNQIYYTRLVDCCY